MTLRFYKHDVDFVDPELGGDGDGDEIHYRVILYPISPSDNESCTIQNLAISHSPSTCSGMGASIDWRCIRGWRKVGRSKLSRDDPVDDMLSLSPELRSSSDDRSTSLTLTCLGEVNELSGCCWRRLFNQSISRLFCSTNHRCNKRFLRFLFRSRLHVFLRFSNFFPRFLL